MSLDKVLSRIVQELSRHDKAVEENKRLIISAPFLAGRASRPTIVSGAITVTRPHVLVIPESGTADDLDTINNFADGKFVMIALADASDTITVRDHAVSGGNIDLHGASWVLDNVNASIFLYYVESTGFWHLAGIPKLDDLRNVDTESASTDDLIHRTVAGNWESVAPGDVIGTVPGPHALTHKHGGTDEVSTSTPTADAIVKALGTGKISNSWLDATLASIASLGTASDRIAYTTGVDVWAETPLTAFVRTILDDADQAAVQVTLALVPGVNIQAFHANLAALSGLTGAADRGFYFTGAGTMALYTLSAYGRTLAALADAAALRTSAGLVAGGAGDIWVEKAGDTMSGPLNMGAQLITNLATPVSAGDAASKAYVDAVAEGLDIKNSVRVASTANVTLNGTQTVDGVSISSGRVLVKNQSTASQNGIYDANSGGAWTRAGDANISADVTSGMFTFVTEGGQGNTGWALTTDDPIVLGTTALTFSQFSGPTNIAAAIDNASETTTPADANKLALVVAGVLTWVSWANIKATLKTYFDTLYALVGHTHASSIVAEIDATEQVTLEATNHIPLTDTNVLKWMSPATLFAYLGITIEADGSHRFGTSYRRWNLQPASIANGSVGHVTITTATINTGYTIRIIALFTASASVNRRSSFEGTVTWTVLTSLANNATIRAQDIAVESNSVTIAGPTGVAAGFEFSITPSGGSVNANAVLVEIVGPSVQDITLAYTIT